MNKRTEAALYRKAAKRIETGENDFACNALKDVGLSCVNMKKLFEADAIEYGLAYDGRAARYAFFSNGVDHGVDFDATVRNHRVLALCFLAAMAEAGDLHD